MAFLDAKTGDLVTFWKSKSSITSLVGAGNDAKIYPEMAPMTADATFALYSQAPGGQSPRHLGGGCGLRFAQINVWAYAATRAAADALADAIRVATENFRGAMGATFVHDVAASAPDSGVDLPQDGSDAKRYWTRIAYEMVHSL